MLQHNKKRNVGLLSEFFARHIATLLVSQKHDAIGKAMKLYEKHFLGNSEIAKEWKVFNALYITNVSSAGVATHLLEKARKITSAIDSKVLESEKTRLIHEINNNLSDKDFFSRPVSDYKIQATIQVLLNSWRDSKINESIYSLGHMASLEDNLLEHLTKNKIRPEGNAAYLEMDNNEIDGLVVNIMSEKFNSKYSNNLCVEQRDIISRYVFSNDNADNKEKLSNMLESIRKDSLYLIENTITAGKIGDEEISSSLSRKLTEIKTLLMTEHKDTSRANDETISFYMTLIKMSKELSNGRR